MKMMIFVLVALATGLAALAPDLAHAAAAVPQLSDAAMLSMAMVALTPAREFGRKEDAPQRSEKEIEKQLKETLDQVKKFAEDFSKKAKDGEQVSSEAKQKADEALTSLTELRGEMTELSQKMAQRGRGDEGREIKSVGQQVGASPELKSFVEAGCSGTMRVQVKAVTSANDSAGSLIVPQRQPGIIELPRQRPRIRSLLMPGRTTSNAVEFARQVSRTNNAAVVAEGAQKPESNYAWEVDSAPVRTIAHWVPASRQAMDDVPQLESLIDGELRYGLDDEEDAELLLGDGTGQHLEGLYTVATAYDDPIDYADPTQIDQLRLALLQVELNDYAPDGMVLHPGAWTGIELTKDAAGGYIFANPLGIAGPVLWGRPVVPTKKIGAGNFLVGAFQMAAQIFDRMDTEVRISDQDRDNFIKNMLTIRAEKRLALAIKRASALVKGTLITPA